MTLSDPLVNLTKDVPTSLFLRAAAPRGSKGAFPRRGGLRGEHQGERRDGDHGLAEEGQCRHRRQQNQHGRHDCASPGTWFNETLATTKWIIPLYLYLICIFSFALELAV